MEGSNTNEGFQIEGGAKKILKNQWSSDSCKSIQEDKYELYNLIFDALLDQIIVEILSGSHQAPQVMPNTTCQSRVNYVQLLQITIVSLFSGVIINHTLRT